jgi:hypothetical protein
MSCRVKLGMLSTIAVIAEIKMITNTIFGSVSIISIALLSIYVANYVASKYI